MLWEKCYLHYPPLRRWRSSRPLRSHRNVWSYSRTTMSVRRTLQTRLVWLSPPSRRSSETLEQSCKPQKVVFSWPARLEICLECNPVPQNVPVSTDCAMSAYFPPPSYSSAPCSVPESALVFLLSCLSALQWEWAQLGLTLELWYRSGACWGVRQAGAVLPAETT